MEQKDITIMLAEDDKNLGTILKAYLEAKGFETSLYVNGKEAFDEYQKKKFNFCIIDVMMPIKDGFTLASEIRTLDKEIPILFLTAKSMQEDKLRGFEIGADDYLTKPFSMEELLARIRAVLRRVSERKKTASAIQIYQIGSLTFDYNRQILTTPKGDNKLTSKETELLRLLCENMNDVLDRSLALKKIWNDDSYFNARSMDVYITKLRKYLKADPKIELINVHGVGFKLVIDL